MNYLALCQRVRQEVGASGTGPTSVTGQTGEYQRIVDWVATAYLDIQLARPDWDWMRRTVQFNTVAGTSTYSLATIGISATFASWKQDSFRRWLVSAGAGSEFFLEQKDYQSFRDYYLFSTRRTTQSPPIAITVNPADKSLILGLVPDAAYTVEGEYFIQPETLAANTDTPAMPTRFHMAVVYRAMMAYGRYENAPEVFADAETNYKRMLRTMELDQLQDVTAGDTLA